MLYLGARDTFGSSGPKPVSRGGGVDALLEHDQVHAALVKQRGDFREVSDRTGHAGQPSDDQLVAGAVLRREDASDWPW
jgi:hypothetical protein